MLLTFFEGLRKGGVPVSIKEFLVLLEALQQHLAFADIDDFYLLARTCLVKDEKHYDKFDRAFAVYFKQLESLEEFIEALIPEDWLRQEFEKHLTEEEKAQIESLGGLEKLIEEFKKRLEEQQKKHAGGSKWIGTGGTSPFGHGDHSATPARRSKRAQRVTMFRAVWVVCSALTCSGGRGTSTPRWQAGRAFIVSHHRDSSGRSSISTPAQ